MKRNSIDFIEYMIYNYRNNFKFNINIYKINTFEFIKKNI